MLKYLLLAAFLPCHAIVSANEGAFDSNGVLIHYVTAGQGEPVVLVHGWMGDSTMWGRDASGNTKLTPPPGFLVIAIDCRGHGKSGKPHEEAKYGPEMAADVVRLLDHLKIQKTHLIGYSMGAFIVAKVAATNPDRVLSIIYGGQAPLLVGRDKSGPSEVEVFAKAVKEGKGLGPYLISVSPSDKPKPTLEQANAIANLLFKGKDLEAFVAAGRSLGRLEVRPDELRRCKAPVLFVHGSKESIGTKKSVDAVRKVLGRGEVRVIDGADHVTTLRRPEFATAIIDFLNANRTK